MKTLGIVQIYYGTHTDHRAIICIVEYGTNTRYISSDLTALIFRVMSKKVDKTTSFLVCDCLDSER